MHKIRFLWLQQNVLWIYVICYMYMYINNFNKNRFSFQLQMEPELNAKKTHGIITVRFFYNLLSINLIKRMNHIQIIRLWWYNCWLQALKEIKLFMLPLCQPDKNRQKLMRNLRVWTEKFILQSLSTEIQLPAENLVSGTVKYFVCFRW